MIIIDRKTGKRVTDTSSKIMNSQAVKDTVKRNVEKGMEGEERSPMDPPDAYSEDNSPGKIKFEEMPSLLKGFTEEHIKAVEQIDKFEKALFQFKEYGYRFDKKINEVFAEFFEFLDTQILEHNNREEKLLFPLLHKRLIKSGEHGLGENPKTAVDLMEDDHVKFIQLGTLAFNMLGLATRLKDDQSKTLVFDIAYNNGRELVEMLRLHIFREDNTLFPLAYKLISKKEFLELEKKK